MEVNYRIVSYYSIYDFYIYWVYFLVETLWLTINLDYLLLFMGLLVGLADTVGLFVFTFALLLVTSLLVVTVLLLLLALSLFYFYVGGTSGLFCYEGILLLLVLVLLLLLLLSVWLLFC